jgi:hypothetical protein
MKVAGSSKRNGGTILKKKKKKKKKNKKKKGPLSGAAVGVGTARILNCRPGPYP